MGFRRRHNTPAVPGRSSSHHRTPGALARGITSPQYSLIQTILLVAFAVVVLLTNTRFWWFIVEVMHFFWTPYTYVSGGMKKSLLATYLAAQKTFFSKNKTQIANRSLSHSSSDLAAVSLEFRTRFWTSFSYYISKAKISRVMMTY